jgi:hypothetical protein
MSIRHGWPTLSTGRARRRSQTAAGPGQIFALALAAGWTPLAPAYRFTSFSVDALRIMLSFPPNFEPVV